MNEPNFAAEGAPRRFLQETPFHLACKAFSKGGGFAGVLCCSAACTTISLNSRAKVRNFCANLDLSPLVSGRPYPTGCCRYEFEVSCPPNHSRRLDLTSRVVVQRDGTINPAEGVLGRTIQAMIDDVGFLDINHTDIVEVSLCANKCSKSLLIRQGRSFQHSWELASGAFW